MENFQVMEMSVVIPTCNRKTRLLALLSDLEASSHLPSEVIIVDGGKQPLTETEHSRYTLFPVRYYITRPSVCAQRNKGISMASHPWIFLCDDDIGVPVEYLLRLSEYCTKHQHVGAVSGLWLQLDHNEWKANFPEKTVPGLLWKYIFQLGIWDGLESVKDTILSRAIKKFYHRKGNHISKAGWPVITDMGSGCFTTPVYGLGASLVKKEWLEQSPYDELLDSHGIGDNYGVALGFPQPVHVLNDAFVFHHQENSNRIPSPDQYSRRIMALDYFIRTGKTPAQVKRSWLLWSIVGRLLMFLVSGDWKMARISVKSFRRILIGANPIVKAVKMKGAGKSKLNRNEEVEIGAGIELKESTQFPIK